MPRTPFKDITEILQLNRRIVLLVVALSLLVCLFAIWTVHRVHNKMLQTAFAISAEGEVLPLKLVDSRENLEVEVRAHLDQFHRLFYGMDPGNYKSQLDKALWLGDSSVDQVYRQKKTEGVYNRLLQFSLRQEITQIEIEVNLNQQPYTFQAVTEFIVYRGAVQDRYRLTTSGKVVHVARNFPHNPHGLLITEFFENFLQKLNDQTQ
jgi:hypothetical protein